MQNDDPDGDGHRSSSISVVDADSAGAAMIVAQIDAKKAEVNELEEAKEFSLIHFAFFPILGPIRRLALARL